MKSITFSVFCLPLMPTRQAFSNFIFTLITLSIMVVVGMLLKARYRLPSEMPAIKAIPVAQAVEDPPVAEPRAYKSGDFWVLSSPKLGKSRGMEADTLRVTTGQDGGPRRLARQQRLRPPHRPDYCRDARRDENQHRSHKGTAEIPRPRKS